MNELWVARDSNGDLFIFSEKPSLKEFKTWDADAADIADEIRGTMFPDLKPGECRRLVMESEVSE